MPIPSSRFRDTPFFVSVDKAKQLLAFEPKHAGGAGKEAHTHASLLTGLAWALTRPAMQWWPPPDLADSPRPPAGAAQRLLCAKRRHSIVDDVSWYFAQNYKAQGGMEKKVDFGTDEALTA